MENNDKNIRLIADAMTRSLMGNKKTALYQLDNFLDDLPKMSSMSNEDYNSLYYGIYLNITKTIKSIYTT